jgi:hypothetical protein
MILMPQVIKNMPPEQLVKWNRRYERKGLYAGSAIQEFLPKSVRGDYLNPRFLEEHSIPENRLTVTSGNLVCEDYTHSGTAYRYHYTASADSEARLALFYWPGWDLRIDGRLQPGAVRIGVDGLVAITLPAGSHQAELRYNLSRDGQAARIFSSSAAVIWISILVVGGFRSIRTKPG